MRPTSVAVTAFACAALLASFPGVSRAQTTTPGTTTTSQTPASRDHVHLLAYGKIVELAADHVTIKPDGADAKRIVLTAGTRYVARNLDAARDGLHEGDYAAAFGMTDTSTTARAADADNVARRLEYDTKPFGHVGSNSTIIGVVLTSGFNFITVRQPNNDAVTVKYTQATRFFVNGKQVQNPPTFRGGEIVRLYVHREPDDSLDALRVAVRLA